MSWLAGGDAFAFKRSCDGYMSLPSLPSSPGPRWLPLTTGGSVHTERPKRTGDELSRPAASQSTQLGALAERAARVRSALTHALRSLAADARKRSLRAGSLPRGAGSTSNLDDPT